MEHLSNRHGAIMGADQLDMQERAVAKATAWKYHHAARLGVSVEEIGAATLRGWTAEDLEALPAAKAAHLASGPPDLELTEAIQRIKVAPVRRVTTTYIRSRV